MCLSSHATHKPQTVYNDFPIPSIPLPEPPPLAEQEAEQRDDDFVKGESPVQEGPPEKKLKMNPDARETPNEANDEPLIGPDEPAKSPSSPKFDTNISPRSTSPLPPDTIPPQLIVLLQTIQSSLKANFPRYPPHTAQRLAELLLRPKAHYRTLPSYLRALDRIVSVASSMNEFPLPSITHGTNNNESNLFNGTTSPDSDPELTDFIGGAELTPIPWLRDTGSPPSTNNGHASDLRTESTSVIDGPNGAGSVETVTVSVNGVSSTMPVTQAQEEGLHHGITQGELIRQEQEAGITPVPTGTTNGRIARSTNAVPGRVGDAAEEGEVNQDASMEEEETVHVRGPPMIGMEDIGAQAEGSGLEKGIEIEGPLGVRKEGETAIDEVMGGTGEEKAVEETAGTVPVDADGIVEGEKGADSDGAEKGADAADATSL